MMKSRPNVEYPECPHCGCENAKRIGPAMLPDETFDEAKSGIFACVHCREEFEFLTLLPIETQENTFSTKAACRWCGSLKTKTTATRALRRYHICFTCRRSFRTIRVLQERRTRPSN